MGLRGDDSDEKGVRSSYDSGMDQVQGEDLGKVGYICMCESSQCSHNE